MLRIRSGNQAIHSDQPVLCIPGVTPHYVAGQIPIQVIRKCLRRRRNQHMSRSDCRLLDSAPTFCCCYEHGGPDRGTAIPRSSNRLEIFGVAIKSLRTAIYRYNDIRRRISHTHHINRRRNLSVGVLVYGIGTLASGHIPFNTNWLGKSLSGNTPTSFVNSCGRVSC